MKTRQMQLSAALLFLCLFSWVRASGQITPSQDAFTNSATPATNFGGNVLLTVNGATEISYIQFNLASIPSVASVSHATLKLYAHSVTTAGSFNVDFVNGSWVEGTITSNLSPALGTTIAPNVSITLAQKNQYILIDITSALQAWLNGSQANDGIALVANGSFNASFDSKESTTTSHPPELDVVFAGGGSGTITGVLTGSGSGLTGGGTTGTLNLSLTKACASKQVLQWNGSSWVCANPGTGTITGVTAGTDLTGGGTSGTVTLNLNTAKVPQLAAANFFSNNQTIAGSSSAFGLTVSQPNYQGILIQGPEANIGAALEFQTTGAGGMFWQILNTGVQASQKANKLTFRNDSLPLDVMTLLANGQVGIGTSAPGANAWLEVVAPQNGGSFALDSNGTNGIVAIGATNPTGESDGGAGSSASVATERTSMAMAETSSAAAYLAQPAAMASTRHPAPTTPSSSPAISPET